MDKERLNQKLDELAGYYNDLIEDLPDLNEFLNQRLKRRGIEKTLELIADTIIDLANILISSLKLEKPEDFEKMDKEIAEGKAVLWEEPDCKNFKDKGVGRYLGNLAPVPSKNVRPEHVLAYYNYNSEFADAKIGNASSIGDDLYEDELAAALFVDPGRIKGCEISRTWYLRRLNETEEDAKLRAVDSIKCAAEEL